jgi:hypothetical protein
MKPVYCRVTFSSPSTQRQKLRGRRWNCDKREVVQEYQDLWFSLLKRFNRFRSTYYEETGKLSWNFNALGCSKME